MRKTLLFITAFCVSIGIANAAVRGTNSAPRPSATKSSNQSSIRNTSKNTQSTQARATTKSVRPATTPLTQSERAFNSRTGTTARVASTGTLSSRTQSLSTSSRSNATPARTATQPGRATISVPSVNSVAFGGEYNTCRAAYFACMDQFCGTINDTYRRCICSSKLSEIQSRERALAQASDQIQDFKNLNLSVIDKTANEVSHMITASTGELTQQNASDTSSGAQTLAGISAVLSNTKNKSLSTQGTLDIAGNINSIWATTDLTGGANLTELTGDALYNAVHAQCSELVTPQCTSKTTRDMVTSAYGMYIENDCSALISALDKQLTNANATIRDTEREMHLARLENYNAHNSLSINECIANIRTDITSDAACGADYVHCLDITGLYLNIATGEPIYSPNFYQLEKQLSLSGNLLTHPSNRLLISDLNRKRVYAESTLNKCQDLSADIWDEFLRQAITEIYQGQQERVRQVKNECLDVVNKCYDEQSQSLKDFTNTKEQLLIGERMELSEQMCQEKLTACSNLYGGGSQGMSELLIAMHDITNQTIASTCLAALQDYAADLCAVPGNDSLHAYPYGCRVYAPGEQKYASITSCNLKTSADGDIIYSDNKQSITRTTYVCPQYTKYTSCNTGRFLSYQGRYTPTPTVGNSCQKCPDGCTCAGKESGPVCPDNICGTDYIGSLYHKLARYAIQACVRPSESNQTLPATVLQDINVVMDKIRGDMATELSRECERLGGTWVDTVWIDTDDTKGKHDITGDELDKKFYSETSANTQWGYCAYTETSTVDTTGN